MKKNNSTLSKVFTYIALALLALAHIMVIVAVILSYKYYALYPSIFVSVIAIVILFLLIIDIILLIGLRHKDIALKIVAGVLALFILIGGTVGVYYINEVNRAVDGVVDGNTKTEQTVSGMFVSYKKTYATLKDMSGKSIGFLNEGTDGITSIATNLLDKNKIDYGTVLYNSYVEMYQALIDGKVDLVVMQSGYRGMFEKDENLDFSKYLDDTVDNYPFEGTVSNEGRKNNKKIDTEPFNVLLIGYSRTEWGSSVGLADSIIVATINPQTYTISMMSIARDSFVPISCYGGAYDKINSGRSTSRACFIETVENFIGREIDFYMEADYEAIVNIVETIDGIWIYNPVAFELDGIYVQEGYFQASGWEALEFCRERHHMPNGDFDRQQHQKEVILAIARKFIEEGDVSLALRAMQAASADLSTDLSVQQLTSIFNMILNTKNYTGLDTFDLIDFHTLRMTGYGGIMYYSYSMRLPLWVYLIYQSSYDESIKHIDEVMGKYDTIKQENTFEFAANDPYVREPFYTEEHSGTLMYQPDPMPPYWATLTDMNFTEALTWAQENGVTLTVKNIMADDPKYDPTLDGIVVDQSVRYGSLISEYPSGTITVMGTGKIDETKQVPNFVGKSYSNAVDWTRTYSVNREVKYETVSDSSKAGKVLAQTPAPGTAIEKARESGGLTVTVGIMEFNANDLIGKKFTEVRDWVENNLSYGATYTYVDSETPGTDKVTNVTYDTSDNSELFTFSRNVVITVEKYRPTYTVTYVDSDGSTVLSTETVKEGNTPAGYTPSKSGYNFAGWDKSYEAVYGDITYKASWTEATETRSIDASQVPEAAAAATSVATEDSTQNGVVSCTATYNLAKEQFDLSTASCIVYTYTPPATEPVTNP